MSEQNGQLEYMTSEMEKEKRELENLKKSDQEKIRELEKQREVIDRIT
jgi:hypothetical protein